MRNMLHTWVDHEDRAVLDAYFADFMLAGALLYRIDPEVFESGEYLRKRTPGRLAQRRAAKNTLRMRTSWHPEAEAAIEQIIDAHPGISQPAKLYLKFEEAGFLIPGSSEGASTRPASVLTSRPTATATSSIARPTAAGSPTQRARRGATRYRLMRPSSPCRSPPRSSPARRSSSPAHRRSRVR